MRTRPVIACLAVFMALPALAEQFATGRYVEKVACQADPSQTYTLYLPSAYTPARTWPLLLVFDPGGRSVAAADVFRDAAERNGWILMSSDNTRSDGPIEPSVKAINAMWPDANVRFAADPRRLYASGFSGGAHFSWLLGKQSGALAGIIATGGRLIPEYMPEKRTYAHFGAAGTADFNFQGMKLVDAEMERRGVPHRLEIFVGEHQWIPKELGAQAIEWMELQAIKEGRRAADAALVERGWTRDLERARALETGGDALGALRLYRVMAATFEGLRDVAEPKQHAALLEKSPAVAAAEKDEKHWDKLEDRYDRQVFGAVAEVRDAEVPPPVARVVHELEIAKYEELAKEDSYAGHAAARFLNRAYVQMAFYVMQEFFNRGEYARAATCLEVATRIRPSAPGPWYNLACAHARAGAKSAALAALAKAVDAGWSDVKQLENDADLASLRGEEGYKALVSRLGS